MPLSKKQFDKLAEISAVFIINFFIFVLSMIFLKISFWESLLYSVFNSLWMPFLILPIFNRIISSNKPKNRVDEIMRISSVLIVNGYRQIALKNNISPSEKMSDKEIIDIYQQVGTAFQDVAREKNEHIPALNLNYIVLKFYQVYESFGKEFYLEHLKYETDKYKKEGLRNDYRKEIKLF